MDIKNILKALEKSWCKETCYPPMRNDWVESNPAYGQCYSTTLIVNDHFGGKILKAKFADGTGHFWNLIDGKEVDLTRSQFSEDEKIPKPVVLSRTEVEKRYGK